MPRLLVDGMQIEAAIDDPAMRTAPNRAPDWWVEFEHGRADEDLECVEWTGDVRHEGEPWARFGRRRDAHVVLLEGDSSAVLVRANSTARIRHEHDDTLALRRLAPYLASLSGRLVLHAAAVSFQMAALFLGEAGAGKSTLALAMDRAGAPVLADDHVTVDAPEGGLVYAHASFPSVSVSRATAEAFGVEIAKDVAGKAFVPLKAPDRMARDMVQGVVFLERGREVAYSPMRPADAVARLLKEAVFVADPADDDAHAARLDACMRLVAHAPPFTLVVPDGLDRLRAALPAIAKPWGGMPS